MSNSSAEPFLSLLRRSLLELRFADPGAFAAIADAVGEVTLAMKLDGEEAFLAFTGGEAVWGRCEQPDVRLDSARTAVAAVLHGDRSLADAIATGELHAVGLLPALLQVHDAFVLYVHARSRQRAASRSLLEQLTGR